MLYCYFHKYQVYCILYTVSSSSLTHRDDGRLDGSAQVAIKIMIKKYLFSDAEKASVEREIEIQKARAKS